MKSMVSKKGVTQGDLQVLRYHHLQLRSLCSLPRCRCRHSAAQDADHGQDQRRSLQEISFHVHSSIIRSL